MARPTACVPWLNHYTVQRPPPLLKWRSSASFIIFVASFSMSMDLFIFGLILPVAPTALSERLHVPLDDRQRWMSILLSVNSAAGFIMSPISGYLSDRIGSRLWPLISGVLALGTGHALLCGGRTLGSWIAGRMLHGAGAAAMWTLVCALLVDTVAGERLGRAMGYVSVGLTLGGLAGSLIGGALYEHTGYYPAFIVGFVTLGIDLGLLLLIIEKKHALKYLHLSQDATVRHQATLEPPAILTGSLTVPTKDGPRSRDCPAPGNQVSHATIKRAYKLLASPRVLVAVWASALNGILTSAMDSVLPLFVKDTYGWEQTAQGLIFMPFVIPSLIGPVVGWLNDRYPKSRRFLAGGSLLLSAPSFVLLQLTSKDDTGRKVLLCVLLVLLGLCLGVLFPLVLTEGSYAASEMAQGAPPTFGEQGPTGLAYGILNAAYSAGSIAGPFLGGSIRKSAGWATMAWVLGLLTGVSAIPVLLSFGGVKSWNRNKNKEQT